MEETGVIELSYQGMKKFRQLCLENDQIGDFQLFQEFMRLQYINKQQLRNVIFDDYDKYRDSQFSFQNKSTESNIEGSRVLA